MTGYEIYRVAAVVLGVLASALATGHVVLHKRDARAAIAWVGFIWLVPMLGTIVYLIFGVNRIRRRAVVLRGGLDRYRAEVEHAACPPGTLETHLPESRSHFHMLARLVGNVVDRPLLPGNRVELLEGGDEAYPAMLEAIRGAQTSVSLVSYIFAADATGLEFARALGEAVRRGVAVRVLVDAMGARYSWPTIARALRREGVPQARFLPPFAPWHPLSFNMRTHRKILVVDGRLGFTGGMNIRGCHRLRQAPRRPVQDVHFRVSGPVVTHLQEVFADDWLFATGEALRDARWFPPLGPAGRVLARGVPDGPDENFEKLRWTLLGALAIARRSVRIVTPYFLPDQSLLAALSLAAMRGVRVDILLPARSNLPLVHCASRAQWRQVLEHGCRLWLMPPPFDHSKFMLVDDCWALLGSANWDARSLRLNFEFNLECYDVDLVQRLDRLFESKRTAARPVMPADREGQSLAARLRDGLAHLLMPYL